jgi:hypothetical protein
MRAPKGALVSDKLVGRRGTQFAAATNHNANPNPSTRIEGIKLGMQYYDGREGTNTGDLGQTHRAAGRFTAGPLFLVFGESSSIGEISIKESAC